MWEPLGHQLSPRHHGARQASSALYQANRRVYVGRNLQVEPTGNALRSGARCPKMGLINMPLPCRTQAPSGCSDVPLVGAGMGRDRQLNSGPLIPGMSEQLIPGQMKQ